MNTPENITELEPGTIFVFGANADGQHLAGAARVAFEKFGAVWGQGDGPAGQTYAVDTMSGFPVMEQAVNEFIGYAFCHPELRFLVTKLGCGIAGYQVADVAPLFEVRPSNVILPIEFEEALR